MSNAQYRVQEPAAQGVRERLTPIQAMFRCVRDVKLFALYIELGGAVLDRGIEYFTRVIKSGEECFGRALASEREEWAKHEKDPEYRMKRLRSIVTVGEALRASNALTRAMDDRRELMLRAVEAAQGGAIAQEVFLKRAQKAFEEVRKGMSDIPLGCDVSRDAAHDAGVPPAQNRESAAQGSPKDGDSPSLNSAGDTPKKAGAATPGATKAA